jgi:hypothetical protein
MTRRLLLRPLAIVICRHVSLDAFPHVKLRIIQTRNSQCVIVHCSHYRELIWAYFQTALSTHLSTLAFKEGSVHLFAAGFVDGKLHALLNGPAGEDARRIGQALEQLLALISTARRHAEDFVCLEKSTNQAKSFSHHHFFRFCHQSRILAVRVSAVASSRVVLLSHPPTRGRSRPMLGNPLRPGAGRLRAGLGGSCS